MEIKSGCDLLEKAKELASKKGLDVSLIACSIMAICDGRNCGLIEIDHQRLNSKWLKKHTIDSATAR